MMTTYNEIKTAIENLPSTVKPQEVKMFDQVHSDGLTQTHQEHIYGEPVVSIRKAIWSDNFTLAEKLELNEALANKLTK